MLLHSVAVQNQNFSGDGITSYDLGVNPLSVILLAMRPLNDTGTLTNWSRWLAAVSSLNRITVRHRGQSIVSMRGDDAAALAVMRHGFQPWLANASDVNDERHCAVLPIFLGRRAYDPVSCFPATRRGELVLELDVDDADTGYNDLHMTVETIEILDARPTEYERKVQLAQTMVIGLNDIDIQLGNVIRGLMLFGTTGFGGASPAPSLGRMQLVADGVGVGYSSSDLEVLYAMNGFRTGIPVDDHVHLTEPSAGVRSGRAVDLGDGYALRAYMDLDPLRDDAHSIDTAQLSRLQLRVDAEAADAVRVIPVERIPV